MTETITVIQTTAGNTFRKKRDSLGRTYYVKDGSGRVSRQSYAAAHSSLDIDLTGMETDETDVPIVASKPTEPADPFDRTDISDELDSDDSRDSFEQITAFSISEPDIPIESYPELERSEQLREKNEQIESEYEKFAWGIRYQVIASDGTPMGRSRRTTRFLSPERDGYLSFETDFQTMIDDLRQIAAGYDGVIVQETVLEAYVI